MFTVKSYTKKLTYCHRLSKPWLLRSVLLLKFFSLNYYQPILLQFFYWRRKLQRIGLHISSLDEVTRCVGTLIQVTRVDHIHFLNHSWKKGITDFGYNLMLPTMFQDDKKSSNDGNGFSCIKDDGFER